MNLSTFCLSKKVGVEEVKKDLPTCAGFVIPHFLSAEECQKLIDLCEVESFKTLPETSLASHRTNTRILVTNSALATSLYDRVESFLPKEIKYEGEAWKLFGVNEHLRFCKYEKGQFFDKHIDGHLTFDNSTGELKERQSFFTLMVYLNDVLEGAGGRTRFYSHDGKQLVVDHVYQPAGGDCMCLDQEKLHDGERLEDGVKYIMRTEVIYKLY